MKKLPSPGLRVEVVYFCSMERRRNKRRTGATSVRERAYRHIKKLISDGILEAGSPISELLLAKELGSSCTPIREAMKQLDAEGLLEQSQNGGMTVAQLKREDIIESSMSCVKPLKSTQSEESRAFRCIQRIAIACSSWLTNCW